MKENADQIQIESRKELRAWLKENHQSGRGVWLVTFKKHCRETYVSYNSIVEELLCFGWIDSVPRKLDEDRSKLWIAPRKPGSGWSRINKQRIEKMEKKGLMTRSGLKKVQAAKKDGTWNTLDAIENLEIPPDLEKAFGRFDAARKYFEAFPRSVKRGILAWIANAKKPMTRAKRIEETARLAAENIRANQWPRSPR